MGDFEAKDLARRLAQPGAPMPAHGIDPLDRGNEFIVRPRIDNDAGIERADLTGDIAYAGVADNRYA